MNTRLFSVELILILVLAGGFASGENIDPYDDNARFAYAENVGWLNFDPAHGPGPQVSSSNIQGFLWAENIGWINLSPANYGGVANDGSGNLSGYAWAENVGWLNFGPSLGGVAINGDGAFDGWAWGENIGWIHFDSLQSYNVRACTVTFEDLHNLASRWLSSMDNDDFAQLSRYWLDFCPHGWQPK